MRLAQGIAFGYIFASDPAATTDTGGNLIVSTLLLVIGVLMLITAYKKWDKDEDPDAPPPKWIATVGSLSALKAFGIGAAVVALSAKQWVFTLAAIGVLGRAHLGPPASIGLLSELRLGRPGVRTDRCDRVLDSCRGGRAAPWLRFANGWSATTAWS